MSKDDNLNKAPWISGVVVSLFVSSSLFPSKLIGCIQNRLTGNLHQREDHMDQKTYRLINHVINDMELEVVGQGSTSVNMVVRDTLRGIKNMQVTYSPPRVVLEQEIMGTLDNCIGCHTELLQINRQLEQGAFALDHTGTKLYFRDTLEIENLDKNELEASLNGVSLALMEFGDRLIEMHNTNHRENINA